ncbi:benzoate 4-monooxygenase cytochrome-like protein P450 [Corynespora cassiicola Philippines]|uniref:Benzoate 4-monooxygenase cytochrome-like protein P450 n=1 Tax=Corynespora cassiicola Philippines TaxID=1448308 RepID=A0A2T2NYQ4_CORCC|nr:benzoate 4-monooxygenase cytochrome-like protein P450 [Corynespora cassiicola Philippines]
MFHILSAFVGYGALCASAALLFGTFKITYNLFFHPLRRYPGPKTWAATRLAWAVSMQSGNLHRRLHELHQEYGPIVRIAPNELSYIDARAWKDIFMSHTGDKVITKNGTWGKQPPGAPESIMSINEAAHTRHRRALMGAFTEHAVAEHAPILEYFVGLMISKFKEQAAVDGQAVVNIISWLDFLTFDISGALSFGESFDCVKNGKAHPWVDITIAFGKGSTLVAAVNFFSPLDKLLKLAIPRSILKKVEYHKAIAKAKVQQRLSVQDGTKSQDYVYSILQYNRQKGEVKISQEELEVDMSLLIFAGAETTSAAMASIFNALLRHPSALRKVEDEVRKNFQHEDEIKVETVAHLEYLTAVIEESVRLYPPASLGIPRVIPKGGENICGQWVPGDTFVSLNQYPAYRSPSNFNSPDSFVPERFTPQTPFPTDNMSAFQPFSTGRHKCLGQKLAMAEMRLTIARILFSFDINAAQEVRDFAEQQTFFVWQRKPLNIGLKLRE